MSEYIETLVRPILRDALVRVSERMGETTLTVRIVVDDPWAKGIVIGVGGETITAVRHLAHRVGKTFVPRVRPSVQVMDTKEHEEIEESETRRLAP